MNYSELERKRKKIELLAKLVKIYGFLFNTIDVVIFRIDPITYGVKQVIGNVKKFFGVKKVDIIKDREWILKNVLLADGEIFCDGKKLKRTKYFFRDIWISRNCYKVINFCLPNGFQRRVKFMWNIYKENLFIVCLDITKEVEMIEDLERKEAFLNSLINSIPHGIILVDSEKLKVIRHKTSVNTADICRTMGIKDGISLYHILPPDRLNFIKYNIDYVKMSGRYRVELIDIQISTDKGETIKKIIQLTFTKVDDMNVLILLNDVTEFFQLKEKYEYLSLHDPLTDLPNRRYLLKQLEHLCIQATRHGRKLAVLFIDIDNFKEINDFYGHDIGDKVLIKISQAIKYCLRPGDVVARMGGDEFIAILDDMSKVEDIQMVCRKIMDSSRNFTKDLNIDVTISIGVSIYPDDSTNPEELIAFADIAMYKVKQEGKNNFEFYSKQLSDKLRNRVNMINRLIEAIRNRSFLVYYQPVVNIKDIEFFEDEEKIREQIVKRDLIIGVEALVRWIDNGRLIPPMDFIPLAEDTNLIVPIGMIVADIATQQISQINKKLFINVSPKEFDYPLYFDNFLKILDKNNFDARMLNIEITESVIMRNIESFMKNVETVRARGVEICIDDFGTGYSSFSSLINIPANTIKIDKFFTHSMDKNDKVKRIVKTIIDIANVLGFSVVAEGVETIEQLKILREYGCNFAQGFLFFKPMPFDELKKIIAPTGKGAI